MMIDLHNHSNYSDGTLTPAELVDMAILNGVDAFALTDHDSVYGCDEIQAIARDKGVRVINGMELSCDFEGESVHIVCLFKDNTVPNRLREFSDISRKGRNERAIKMLEKISQEYGVRVNTEQLKDSKQVITRAHMCQNLLENNDISESLAREYSSKESRGYIPFSKMSVENGLRLGHECGCFCILAHPCLIKNQARVERLLAYGFDGIEVRYPDTRNDESKYRALAEKYGVLPSAGSDYHGDTSHAKIGTCTLDYGEFLPIAKKIGFEF